MIDGATVDANLEFFPQLNTELIAPLIQARHYFKQSDIEVGVEGQFSNLGELLEYGSASTGELALNLAEVVHRLYLRFGKKCVLNLEGAWRLAIYDRLTDSLFVSTDRFAQLPIYFTRDRNNRSLIAGEIQLLGPGLKNTNLNLKHDGADTPSPFCEPTFLNDVWQLRPGSSLEINAAGRWNFNRWWSWAKAAEPMSLSDIRTTLANSIKASVRGAQSWVTPGFDGLSIAATQRFGEISGSQIGRLEIDEMISEQDLETMGEALMEDLSFEGVLQYKTFQSATKKECLNFISPIGMHETLCLRPSYIAADFRIHSERFPSLFRMILDKQVLRECQEPTLQVPSIWKTVLRMYFAKFKYKHQIQDEIQNRYLSLGLIDDYYLLPHYEVLNTLIYLDLVSCRVPSSLRTETRCATKFGANVRRPFLSKDYLLQAIFLSSDSRHQSNYNLTLKSLLNLKFSNELSRDRLVFTEGAASYLSDILSQSAGKGFESLFAQANRIKQNKVSFSKRDLESFWPILKKHFMTRSVRSAETLSPVLRASV